MATDSEVIDDLQDKLRETDDYIENNIVFLEEGDNVIFQGLSSIDDIEHVSTIINLLLTMKMGNFIHIPLIRNEDDTYNIYKITRGADHFVITEVDTPNELSTQINSDEFTTYFSHELFNGLDLSFLQLQSIINFINHISQKMTIGYIMGGTGGTSGKRSTRRKNRKKGSKKSRKSRSN